MVYTQAVEPSTFVDLLKERGPLTIWEMSVIIETDISRVQEKIEPLINDGMIVSFEEQGRTYYKISGGENNHNKNKSFLSSILARFNKKLSFEPLPDRIAVKQVLTSQNNYKKLIQEAYVLTLPPNPYTEEERIKTNLWVERDLKKLTTLDEKRLFLSDFIYEKSLGKKKDYLKKRKLLGE